MTAVLVTGASGFLGKALVRRLVRDGRPVIAVLRPDSDPTGLEMAVIERHDGTTTDLRRIVEKHRPETVFHLATLCSSDTRSEDEIEPLIRSNVLFGVQLAEACVRAGTTKFINAGTYYERRGGIETYDPVSLYAATKKAFRDLLEYYANATSLRVATMTLYDTYGPGDERPKLLNLLSRHAASGEPISLSPGEQLIDLIHADDASAAFLRVETLLGEASEPRAKEWCAVSGERRTLRALVALFKEATGLSPDVRFGAKAYRDREVMKPWQGETVPGWKPVIPLKEGLRLVYGAAARA